MSLTRKNPWTVKDGKCSAKAEATISFDSRWARHAVMVLRGFPDGMPLDKYPTGASCESASPGIQRAQAHLSGTIRLPCTITVDKDGKIEVVLDNRLDG